MAAYGLVFGLLLALLVVANFRLARIPVGLLLATALGVCFAGYRCGCALDTTRLLRRRGRAGVLAFLLTLVPVLAATSGWAVGVSFGYCISTLVLAPFPAIGIALMYFWSLPADQ